MTTAVEYSHISKHYGENRIFDDFSLKIEKGTFLTIIGSSGCGKTTLLKMTNRLIEPDAGDVFVDGKNIKTEDITLLRRNTGYAIQGGVLFPHLTVRDNIAYVPNLLNKKDTQKTERAVRKWIEITGLDKSMLDRYPDELSGGQQQRVGIARSLAASPDLLLMDEPFGAVDAITRLTLQDELADIHKRTGITILFVTHDMIEALKLGTKVLALDEGKTAQFDTPENILKNPAPGIVERLVTGMKKGFELHSA